MAIRKCIVCNQEIPSKNSKYCSRKCMAEFNTGKERLNMKGRISWNAGLSAETDIRIAKVAFKRLKNVVDKDTLTQLYIVENLSLKAIGLRYGVSKQVIKRLVEKFQLQRTPRKMDDLSTEIVCDLVKQGVRFVDIARQYNCSPATVQQYAYQVGVYGDRKRNRAGIEPSKELLESLYCEQWLSYEAIAKQLGVDMTSIPYWLKKFQIPRRTVWETRRGKDWKAPDPNIVAHLYESENMGMDAIGSLFGASKTYIEKFLTSLHIPLRKSGYPNVSQYVSKDGHHVKSSLELQVDDWLYNHQVEHVYEPFIANTKYRADFLVGTTFIEIWGITGHEAYENKRKVKLEVYASHNLDLISVYPHDFPELHVLDPLIKHSLNLQGNLV